MRPAAASSATSLANRFCGIAHRSKWLRPGKHLPSQSRHIPITRPVLRAFGLSSARASIRSKHRRGCCWGPPLTQPPAREQRGRKATLSSAEQCVARPGHRPWAEGKR